MKKTILTGASILALSMAAPAFGQVRVTDAEVPISGNFSDIDQNGNSNEANVEQGPGVESVSEITQTGNANYAEVDQQNSPAGSNNFSFPANESDIDQTGNNNFASVTQNSQGPGTADNNDSQITQFSDVSEGSVSVADALADNQVTPSLTTAGANRTFSNAAVVRQTSGTGNNSLIEQGTAATPVSGNLAYVEQIGSGHDATILQTGFNNTALIDESGDALNQSNNDVTIMQTGDDNLADVDQDGNDLSTSVTQGGNRNEAFVMDQEGSSNMVFVNQSGDDNLATVGGDLGDQGGSSNLADIDQGGNENEATIVQASSGNMSFIDQVLGGDENEATSIQTTSDNFSQITQMGGTGNIATVMQTVTSGSTSDVLQNGNSNTATVNQ